MRHLNPAFVEGTPQYAANFKAMEAAKAAYKAGKQAGRQAVKDGFSCAAAAGGAPGHR